MPAERVERERAQDPRSLAPCRPRPRRRARGREAVRTPYRAVYWIVRLRLEAAGSRFARRPLDVGRGSGLRNERLRRAAGASPRSGTGRVRALDRREVDRHRGARCRGRARERDEHALPAGATVTRAFDGFVQTPPSQRERASVRSRRTVAAPSPNGSSLVIRRRTRSLCLSAAEEVRVHGLREARRDLASRPRRPCTYGALRRGRKRKSGTEITPSTAPT